MAPNPAEVTEPAPVARPWALGPQKVLDALGVAREVGLSREQVLERRRRWGSNQLRETARRHGLAILLDQVKSVVILLLIAAGLLALAFGEIPEALAILTVIFVNTGIGFVTELRAIRSMEALRQLGRVETTVRRAGSVESRLAQELVPGDIVIVQGGDVITADLRLIEASRLEADESALTGESVPVAKQTELLPPDTHLSERTNLVFKGTAITRGSGEAVVVATGEATELGQISTLVRNAEAVETPLEKRLDALGRRMVWVTLVVAILVAVSGLASGRDVFLAIEISIALAVAAIPEGLPIVATIALARGMWRMARRHALVSRLSAVETLGATAVILTDKTGTLTENRMSVSHFVLDGLEVNASDLERRPDESASPGAEPASALDELMVSACLCNNATLDRGAAADEPQAVGDPTEAALLVAAARCGYYREALLEAMPELREEPFDSDIKMMATFHRREGAVLVAVKGAPEAVIERCESVRGSAGVRLMTPEMRDEWERRSLALGEQGLRTLALASKVVADAAEDPYRGLVLLGLAALLDPPRAGVETAIRECREAGIRVVMVTGDQLGTARTVASAVGVLEVRDPPEACVDARWLEPVSDLPSAQRAQLLSAQVFARTSPRQKLELIDLHQQAGNVVAMTGDGINDAPALKKADIGVAMGIRGTQVAKEAAAMVLQDDEFATIVHAVEQGRAIYANLRKFVVYLMSCNLSEVLIVGLASLAGAPLPLLPLQILFLNLVTDVFPALALGVGEGDAGIMRERPRPADEALLTRGHWLLIAGYGIILSSVVLAAMGIAMAWLGMSERQAVSVSFLTLAFAQLWHVFNMRAATGRWTDNEIVRNPWIWAAIALCILLVLAAVYTPGLSELLRLDPPGASGWALVLAMSLLPLALGPLAVRFGARLGAGGGPGGPGRFDLGQSTKASR